MQNIKYLLFFSILCSLVLFTNCGEDSEDPVADDTTGDTNTDDDSSETVKYNLTVEISPTEGGLVSYQSGPFTEGTKVTLTATLMIITHLRNGQVLLMAQPILWN